MFAIRQYLNKIVIGVAIISGWGAYFWTVNHCEDIPYPPTDATEEEEIVFYITHIPGFSIASKRREEI